MVCTADFLSLDDHETKKGTERQHSAITWKPCCVWGNCMKMATKRRLQITSKPSFGTKELPRATIPRPWFDLPFWAFQRARLTGYCKRASLALLYSLYRRLHRAIQAAQAVQVTRAAQVSRAVQAIRTALVCGIVQPT